MDPANAVVNAVIIAYLNRFRFETIKMENEISERIKVSRAKITESHALIDKIDRLLAEQKIWAKE